MLTQICGLRCPNDTLRVLLAANGRSILPKCFLALLRRMFYVAQWHSHPDTHCARCTTQPVACKAYGVQKHLKEKIFWLKDNNNNASS